MDIVHLWYRIVDSWFSVTITIGIIALIGAVLYNIVRTVFGRDSEPKT